MPGPGRVAKFVAPEGSDVRFDTMLYEGCVIPPFYDSLLGKLIAGGETRPAALAGLRSALGDLTIEGVPTTRDLHLALLDNESVKSGAVHTRWLEGWLASGALTKGKAA
jgi:acetyl-CoA carboxylase, biotin carboxylase subunit